MISFLENTFTCNGDLTFIISTALRRYLFEQESLTTVDTAPVCLEDMVGRQICLGREEKPKTSESLYFSCCMHLDIIMLSKICTGKLYDVVSSTTEPVPVRLILFTQILNLRRSMRLGFQGPSTNWFLIPQNRYLSILRILDTI